MLTNVFMGVLVLALAVATLWKIQYKPEKNSFMSFDDTSFLRGFWCIIVVLVHVPAEYQNSIQDMIGSFAYIGVTFFFMTSSFGLKYSIEHKEGYMNCFWRRRLPPILIPALLANAIQVLAYGLSGESITILSFINIDAWVKVLLLYYVLFWLIYGILPRIIQKGYWQDIVMCILVIGCSLVDYYTDFKITYGWITEPLGFAYGIIAACFAQEIKKWIGTNWVIKSILLMLFSGLFGVLYIKNKQVLFWGDYVLKVLLGITITLFVLILLGKLTVGNKINRFLGSISYEIYLIHHAVFALLMAIDSQMMNSGLFVVSSVCITIMVAFCLKEICKPIIKKISTALGQE